MASKNPLKNGDEIDAVSRKSRKIHSYRPGVLSEIKRRIRRRDRRETKTELRRVP